MAKGKRSSGRRGVSIRSFTTTQGAIAAAGLIAAALFVHNKLSKSAQDERAKDSLTNKVASALGYSGAGIAA